MPRHAAGNSSVKAKRSWLDGDPVPYRTDAPRWAGPLFLLVSFSLTLWRSRSKATDEVAAVNRELEKRKLEPLKTKSKEEWEKEEGKRTASLAALPAFLPFSGLPLNVAGAD